MITLGIDLGTTNSLGVVYREKGVDLIPNAFGEYMTPSAVYIDESGNAIVGKVAIEKLCNDPINGIKQFKRLMGSSKTVNLRNKEFKPEELSALVVQQIINDAETYLNDKVGEVVISVPAYFNAIQRKATKKVGDYLHVKVDRIINEPSAAALNCYDFVNETAFVVFDFGGGTLDVSVVDCFESIVSICSIAGDNKLGGIDFDEIIMNDFLEKNSLDKQSSLIVPLLQQCEKVKHHLQKHETCDTKLSYNGNQYDYTLSRDEFYMLSNALLEKIRYVVGLAIKESGFTKKDIDRFILVGGSCHMPILHRYLKELISVEVESAEDLDYMVAKGLGKYIGIKERDERVKQMILTDICPFSLNVDIVNHENKNNPLTAHIITRNSVLPTSQSHSFVTSYLGQHEVSFKINQGESKYAKENIYLGEIILKVPVNYDDHEETVITFSYDINSLLHIEALVCSLNEVHYYVLDGSELRETKTKGDTGYINEFMININQVNNFEYIKDKKIRINAIADDQVKLNIEKEWKLLTEVIEKYSNNIRLVNNAIQKFEKFLNKVESDCLNLDVFTDFEDEGGKKGFLS